MAMSKEELLAELRKKLDEQRGGRKQDETEFRPPKVKPSSEELYKFVILPPLEKGDVCAGGTASEDMVFPWVEYGLHWINSRPTACPRINGGPQCPLCELGFDLHKATPDPDQRKDIIRTYMPSVKYLTNVYFPDNDQTPEELRGTVKWIAMPKTIKDIMEKTLRRDDDGGDPDKPLPYGVFWYTGAEKIRGNTGGYTFRMHIKHKGGYNDYEQSEFLARTMRPLVSGPDGDPDVEKISTILAQRHDLYTKMDAVNLEQLQQITAGKLAAITGTVTSGFDKDEGDTVGQSGETTTTTETTVESVEVPETVPSSTDAPVADDEKLAQLLAKLHSQSE